VTSPHADSTSPAAEASGRRDVDVVRAMLLAGNAGDVEAFLACVHPDVEWHSAGLFIHPAKAWHGRDEMRGAMEQRLEHYRGHPQVTLTEVECVGSVVLVVGTVAIPAARQPVVLPGAFIFEVLDGQVHRAQAFTNERRARADWSRRTRGGGPPSA